MNARPWASQRRAMLSGAMTATLLLFAAAVLALAAVQPASADVNTFTLKQPLENATVREVVPIRAPRTVLGQAAYATVQIDGQFRAAPAVPDSGDVLYAWDTKNPFTTQDQPDVTQTTSDGKHTVVVDLFDKDSNEIATASSTVRVANKINSLPDGVKLAYKWGPSQLLVYHLRANLYNSDSKNIAQAADVHFDRGVEDNSHDILIRDLVDTDGMIAGSAGVASAVAGGSDAEVSAAALMNSGAINGGAVQSTYQISSKYWTIDKYGQLLTDNRPIAAGDHIGFPVVQVPQRRVNVGDSWQTPIMCSLQWGFEKPTILHGQARLDGFEWQNGYPTAKIIESYDGPAQFYLLGNGPDAGAPVTASNVHFQRSVWFAYEAGMVVRTETTLHADTTMTSNQYSSLGAGSAGAQPNMMAQGMPGMPGGGGPFGGAGMPNAGQIAAMQAAAMAAARGGAGGYMGGMVPGAPVAANPIVQGRADQTQQTAVHLDKTETTVLSSVGSS